MINFLQLCHIYNNHIIVDEISPTVKWEIQQERRPSCSLFLVVTHKEPRQIQSLSLGVFLAKKPSRILFMEDNFKWIVVKNVKFWNYMARNCVHLFLWSIHFVYGLIKTSNYREKSTDYRKSLNKGWGSKLGPINQNLKIGLGFI